MGIGRVRVGLEVRAKEIDIQKDSFIVATRD
jgi:hypothetical protein